MRLENGVMAVLLSASLSVGGAACTGDGGTGTGGGAGGGNGAGGTVAGTVSIFRGASQRARVDPTLAAFVRSRQVLARPRLSTSGALHGVGVGSPVRPGEIIVRFHEVLDAAQALTRVRQRGLKAAHGGYASPFLHLVTFTREDGRALGGDETQALADRLSRVQGVRFAEVNRVRHALAVPDDTLYPAQWHYPAMNLPAAWDLTQGSSQVVVAIIDTGIVTHPDFGNRVLTGFDMISDATMAQDGDGRDGNAADQGNDLPNGQSSWHGTHVAGTIGAATNNRVGVAGVDWNARLLPVRVLGKGGGTDFDIAAGMQWASGGTVPGVPANPTPAAVLNLSLGGEGGPLMSYQDVIDEAVGRGAVLVVAAGNDNIDASRFTPCNQQQVICVGATRFNGKRASYSNFGAAVHLVAPGGEVVEDSNGDGYPDGVLSTFQDGATAVFQFEQGTSMASPHIAGVVALMKARAASVTAAQAKAALTSTANAAFQCSEGCGAGLVNAHAAVLAASGQAPAGPAKLVLSTAELFLTAQASAQTLTVSNVGGQPAQVSLTAGGTEGARLSFPSGSQASVGAGQAVTFPVQGNLQGLADGVHTASIAVSSPAGSATVTVKLRAGTAANQAPAVVALVYQDPQGEWQIGGAAEATAANGYRFELTAPAGEYFVLGLVDANDNGDLDDGEPFGLWPTTDSPRALALGAGERLTGVDFVLAPDTNIPDQSASAIGGACVDNSVCGAGGECLTNWPGGYCSSECRATPCPLGSKCIDFGTVQACLATCVGPRAGRSSCRASYVCEDDGTGAGVCIPACTSAADCGGATCDLGTGYCG